MRLYSGLNKAGLELFNRTRELILASEENIKEVVNNNKGDIISKEFEIARQLNEVIKGYLDKLNQSDLDISEKINGKGVEKEEDSEFSDTSSTSSSTSKSSSKKSVSANKQKKKSKKEQEEEAKREEEMQKHEEAVDKWNEWKTELVKFQKESTQNFDKFYKIFPDILKLDERRIVPKFDANICEVKKMECSPVSKIPKDIVLLIHEMSCSLI